MSDSQQARHSLDERFDVALGEYMRRLDRGELVDRDDFLAAYPDVEGELRQHFAACDFIEQMAGPSHAGPSHAGSSHAGSSHAGSSHAGSSHAGSPRSRDRLAQPARMPQHARKPDSKPFGDDETVPPTTDMVPRALRHEQNQSLRGTFGRYEITDTLGEGGMGSVYLANDPKLDRLVALKIPLLQERDRNSVLERFLREARAAASIQHANICPIFDVGVVKNLPYITMAYIEGKPLSKFIQPDRLLARRSVLLLIRRIAIALHEAHEQGVIHRDLKPSNIMINRRNEPLSWILGSLDAKTLRAHNSRNLVRSSVRLGICHRNRLLGPATR